MPVTAKLSRKFYDKFGDELTNELVGLLNNVDTTYRTELRELNESNFARFDAKLGAKLDAMEARFDARLDAMEARFDGKLARLEGGLLARIGMAEGRLARQTLTYWIATLATIVALLKL